MLATLESCQEEQRPVALAIAVAMAVPLQAGQLLVRSRAAQGCHRQLAVGLRRSSSRLPKDAMPRLDERRVGT